MLSKFYDQISIIKMGFMIKSINIIELLIIIIECFNIRSKVIKFLIILESTFIYFSYRKSYSLMFNLDKLF